MEVWKDIWGYLGLYEVSNFGRVRSLTRYVNHLNSKRQLKRGKVLSLSKDRAGYMRCALSVGNKLSSFRVHRLVAIAFLSNPDNLKEINHRDCDKANNHWSNLEWSTRRHNIIHAIENGRIKYNKGEFHHNSKLTNIERREIISLRNKGYLLREISELYPIHIGTISKICHGSSNS